MNPSPTWKKGIRVEYMHMGTFSLLTDFQGYVLPNAERMMWKVHHAGHETECSLLTTGGSSGVGLDIVTQCT